MSSYGNVRKRRFRRATSLILTIAVCGLVLYFNYVNKNGIILSQKHSALISEKNRCRNICTTKACVKAANYFEEIMNHETDPCEDSYSFFCGNFQTYLADEDLSFNNVDFMELLLNMKEVIENIKDPPESLAGKVKTIYDSCMDANSSDFRGVDTLSEYMSKFGVPGWPNLGENFTFAHRYDSLAAFSSHNDFFHTGNGNPLLKFGPPPIPFEITSDMYNILHDPVVLSSANTNTTMNTRLNLMVHTGDLLMEHINVASLAPSLLSYLGALTSQIQTILDDYVVMEKAMGEIRNAFNDRHTYPWSFDCETENNTLLCETLKSFVKHNGLENIYSSTKVTVRNMPFMLATSKLVSTASDRTLANYMSLRFVLHNRYELDVASEQLSKRDSNRYPPFPLYWFDMLFLGRWRRCVAFVGTHLNPILASVYMRTRIGKTTLRESRQMVDFYMGIASHLIRKQTWIEESRREEFSEFIQGVVDKLHKNVDLRFNSSSTAVFYDELKPSRESFLHNILELKKFYMKQNMVYPNFATLGDIFIGDNPFQKNAKTFRYNIGVEVQYGLLLPPFYEEGRPRLLNFATIGDIVGHEVGHEINKLFCNLFACILNERTTHLDSITMENFKIKKECLVEQYSEFDIKGMGRKNNGAYTFPENFGDLVASELTPKMVEIFLAEQGDAANFSLPGLDYNFLQMIHVSTNQLYCEKINLVEHDMHSPNEIRVRVKAQNSKHFSEVFECAEGSKMNPENKCSFFETE